jgi:predicted ATPase
VAAICRHLDGLPLALELAAARVKLLSPAELLPHIEHRLAVLTGGARDLPERHQSLRAAIAWSYDALPPSARAVFRHLAVFAGGGTVGAVAQVVGMPEGEALEHLTTLVEQSLIQPRESAGETHLEMLETVREYGLAQLGQVEATAARRAHAEYYLALAETAHAALDGPAGQTWLARLTVDFENCVVAMEWARDNHEYELGLRLASALALYWDLRGHASGGRRWLEMFLRRSGLAEHTVPVPLRARAFRAAGDLAIAHNDFRRADVLFGAARELQLAHAATDAGVPPFDDYTLEAHD